jgi:hypothetical protein
VLPPQEDQEGAQEFPHNTERLPRSVHLEGGSVAAGARSAVRLRRQCELFGVGAGQQQRPRPLLPLPTSTLALLSSPAATVCYLLLLSPLLLFSIIYYHNASIILCDSRRPGRAGLAPGPQALLMPAAALWSYIYICFPGAPTQVRHVERR